MRRGQTVKITDPSQKLLRDIPFVRNSFSSSSMSRLSCSMALLQVSISISRTSGVVVSEQRGLVSSFNFCS